MTGYGLLAVILILCALSVRERAEQLRKAAPGRGARAVSVTPAVTGLPFQPRPSFVSEALAGLLGTAGGIYLTLVMGAAFLGFGTPARVPVGGTQVDPLAVVSLAVAIVQPFAARAVCCWTLAKGRTGSPGKAASGTSRPRPGG